VRRVTPPKRVAIPGGRPSALLIGPCLLLVAILGACSSNSTAGGSADKQSTTTSLPTSSTAVPSTALPSTTTSFPVTGPSVATIAASKTVTVGGRTVKVPTDSDRPISSSVADGQEIIISVGGFLPQRLYSTPSDPIVWTNLTNQPEQVIFDHFPVTSPMIPPGGTFSWKSAASESVSYHSSLGDHAVVVINPPGI